MICVLCNEEFEEIENVKWGNLEFQCVGGHNPAPLAEEGRHTFTTCLCILTWFKLMRCYY